MLAGATAVAVAMMLALVGGCSTDSDSAGSAPAAKPGGEPAARPLDEMTKVTTAIPFEGIEGFAPVLLGKELGEFEKENIDLQIEILPIQASIAALQQGQLQFVPAGYSAGLLNAVAAGADVAVVAGLGAISEDNKTGVWVSKKFLGADGKPDACKLRGQTVGLNGSNGKGSAAALPMARFLKTCGLDLSDVNTSTLGGASVLPALKQGTLAAATLSDPIWEVAEAEGDYAIPAYQDITGAPKMVVWMGKLRQENPEVAEAIIRAMVRTVRTYLQGDYHADDDVMRSLSKVTKTPVEMIRKGPSLVFDSDMALRAEKVVTPLQDMWLDVGGVLTYEEPLELADIVDTTTLESVLSR